MGDRPWEIFFSAKPIIVHATDEKKAIEIAIEYLRQPEANRIIVKHKESPDVGV